MGQMVFDTPTQVCHCSEKVAEEEYLSEGMWLCSNRLIYGN